MPPNKYFQNWTATLLQLDCPNKTVVTTSVTCMAGETDGLLQNIRYGNSSGINSGNTLSPLSLAEGEIVNISLSVFIDYRVVDSKLEGLHTFEPLCYISWALKTILNADLGSSSRYCEWVWQNTKPMGKTVYYTSMKTNCIQMATH